MASKTSKESAKVAKKAAAKRTLAKPALLASGNPQIAKADGDAPVQAQSLAKVYLHVVFSTKNRAPLLADEWRDELFRVMGGAANNLGCQSLIVGGVADHVHILFQLGRTITIADAVGKIKSTSSAWINQTRGLSVEFRWQAGYAAFSVSQSNIEAVREYIRKQAEHHAKQAFQDELREWLRRYEIEWDERYVWD